MCGEPSVVSDVVRSRRAHSWSTARQFIQSGGERGDDHYIQESGIKDNILRGLSRHGERARHTTLQQAKLSMTTTWSVDVTLAGTCIYPATLAPEGATSMPCCPMTGSHRAIYRLSGRDFRWDQGTGAGGKYVKQDLRRVYVCADRHLIYRHSTPDEKRHCIARLILAKRR